LQVSGGETRKQWAALRLRGAVDKAMIHSSHSFRKKKTKKLKACD
jgi:hypothetical protein